METLLDFEKNGEHLVRETSEGKISSLSSVRRIADPVIYKLVRVEGDGRLVPATDDEVMEVEDLLEDDKSEQPSVGDTESIKGCASNDGFSAKKPGVHCSEGSGNTEVDTKSLNARLEYIEEMLLKVKREERLRLSRASPINVMASDLCEQSPSRDGKPQPENPAQESIPPLSPTKVNDLRTGQSGIVETSPELMDGPVTGGAIISDSSTFKHEFSATKEICLDNLSIRELQETFRTTFGRETSVKDKVWLKRRIAMGLTNSCIVPTTTFIIKGKTLVSKEVEGASGSSNDREAINDACRDNSTSSTDQLQDRHILSGKRLRKPKREYEEVKSEDHAGHTAGKRARRPTRRYIEELPEIKIRECTGRLISSAKSSEHSHTLPGSQLGLAPTADDAGTAAAVTRKDSFGGSQVPYVSRVRRARPRQDFMALMEYQPSGMVAIKEALGVHISQQDGENRSKMVWKTVALSEQIEQLSAETEREKQGKGTHFTDGHEGLVKDNADSSGDDNLNGNVATVPTSNGGTRRKHHRAWTLGEVMKLVEGVSRYGAGRWSEIKRLAFASYSYRTSVDLKDKWRNLLRASFSQEPSDKGVKNSRKQASIPIPAGILVRVRELAEMHGQATYYPTCRRFGGNHTSSSRNVNETRSGFL